MSKIKLVNPKGNQPWIFIGRTNAESWNTKTLATWLIGKDPDAGIDWGHKQKGVTEDEMVGWHHPVDGHEFEQILGDSEGQGSLACYSPWGRKESHMTEQLNNKQHHSSHLLLGWPKDSFKFFCKLFFFFIFMYILIIKCTSNHVFPQSFLSWHRSLCAHLLISFL